MIYKCSLLALIGLFIGSQTTRPCIQLIKIKKNTLIYYESLSESQVNRMYI